MAADSHRHLDELFQHNKHFYKEELAVGEFRLLTIDPGRFQDPLSCRLHTLDRRAQADGYNALSYAWMASVCSAYHSILLNGVAGCRVTDSLFGALRRLRHPTTTKSIWIDAICINQANIAERSAQVAIMADIFGAADVVYVWLGPCGILKSTAEEQDECSFHEVTSSGYVAHNLPDGLETEPLLESEEAGKAQWWWRTWTVQEFVLAREIKVIVGPHQISWKDTRNALQRCLEGNYDNLLRRSTSAAATKRAYQQLCNLERIRDQQSLICSELGPLLKYTSANVAGDPRDRVYGLLGLLETPNDMVSKIKPDYNKSYIEVCMETTLYLIEERQSLNIFVDNWQRLSGFPSWALDIAEGRQHSAHSVPEGIPLDGDDNELLSLEASASGAKAPEYRLDKQKLVVRGVVFETVKVVIPPFLPLGHQFAHDPRYPIAHDPGHTSPLRFFQAEEEQGHLAKEAEVPHWKRSTSKVERGLTKLHWALNASDWCATEAAMAWIQNLAQAVRSESQDGLGIYTSNIDLVEQVTRTMTAGKELRLSLQLGSRTTPLDQFDSHYAFVRSQYWSSFIRHAKPVMRSRPLLFTTAGMCGVSQREVHVGDIIVVLFGCSVPVILRPAENAGEYTIVGESLVHGIMYGKLAAMYDEGQVQAQDFCIV